MSKKRLVGVFVVVALIAGSGVGAYVAYSKDKDPANPGLVTPDNKPPEPAREPKLATETMTEGLDHPWDLAFLDNDTAVFNERNGTVYGMTLSSKQRWQITKISNVQVEGEGGLLGLAIDREFATNNYAYVCYNATGAKRSVRVARFKIAADRKSISEFKDIISDIESQAGRHSGCRIAMGADNSLWIGTGDSALPTAPQNPKSLAGKILHVDREGKGVAGNMPAPYDNRIYNYGHRNVQGLVLLAQPMEDGTIGMSAEHGPDKQDEINWIKPGNFGWNPVGTGSAYNESVPMTDTTKYPSAVPAIWNSGNSTVAVSGMSFLTSSKWNLWQGWTALATLKGQHVRVLKINQDGKVAEEKQILTDFGRIRTVVEGSDGSLYLTTDNGEGKDKIIKVTPS